MPEPSLENESADQRDARALRALFNHPEVGAEAKRLYKEKVDPQARFADLEVQDRIDASNKTRDDEIKSLRERVERQDIETRRKEKHDQLRARGLDPIAVEKCMTDNKIHDYDAAARFVELETASAPSSASSITPIRMPDDSKEIAKNPTKWGRDMAHKAIDELKAQRRKQA